MIVKRQFTPAAMWPYVRFDLALAAFASVAAWLLVQVGGVRQVAQPTGSVVLPFAVIGSLARDQWLIIPATVVIAFAFRMLEQIGSLDTPFGNTKQDVPLTAITTIVERDLLTLVGDPARPEAPQPVSGYLW